jgi:hypothetical protein
MRLELTEQDELETGLPTRGLRYRDGPGNCLFRAVRNRTYSVADRLLAVCLYDCKTLREAAIPERPSCRVVRQLAEDYSSHGLIQHLRRAPLAGDSHDPPNDERRFAAAADFALVANMGPDLRHGDRSFDFATCLVHQTRQDRRTIFTTHRSGMISKAFPERSRKSPGLRVSSRAASGLRQ